MLALWLHYELDPTMSLQSTETDDLMWRQNEFPLDTANEKQMKQITHVDRACFRAFDYDFSTRNLISINCLRKRTEMSCERCLELCLVNGTCIHIEENSSGPLKSHFLWTLAKEIGCIVCSSVDEQHILSLILSSLSDCCNTQRAVRVLTHHSFDAPLLSHSSMDRK